MTSPVSREEVKTYQATIIIVPNSPGFAELKLTEEVVRYSDYAALRARVLELEQLVTDGQEAIGHWQGEARTLQQQLQSTTRELTVQRDFFRDSMHERLADYGEACGRERGLRVQLQAREATIARLEGQITEANKLLGLCVEPINICALVAINDGTRTDEKTIEQLKDMMAAYRDAYILQAQQARGEPTSPA